MSPANGNRKSERCCGATLGFRTSIGLPKFSPSILFTSNPYQVVIWPYHLKKAKICKYWMRTFRTLWQMCDFASTFTSPPTLPLFLLLCLYVTGVIFVSVASSLCFSSRPVTTGPESEWSDGHAGPRLLLQYHHDGSRRRHHLCALHPSRQQVYQGGIGHWQTNPHCCCYTRCLP